MVNKTVELLSLFIWQRSHLASTVHVPCNAHTHTQQTFNSISVEFRMHFIISPTTQIPCQECVRCLMLVRNVYESITFVFWTLSQNGLSFSRSIATMHIRIQFDENDEICGATKDNDVGGQWRAEESKKKSECCKYIWVKGNDYDVNMATGCIHRLGQCTDVAAAASSMECDAPSSSSLTRTLWMSSASAALILVSLCVYFIFTSDCNHYTYNKSISSNSCSDSAVCSAFP